MTQTSTATAAPRQQLQGLQLWVPIVVLWIVWGSTFLGVSTSVQTMPPLVSAGMRYLIAGLLLLGSLVLLQPESVRAITRKQFPATLVLGLGTVGIWGGSSATSQRYIPGGVAAIIAASVPLWVVVFRRLGGDKPRRLTLVGVIVGLLALASMLLPGAIVGINGADTHTVLLWSSVMLLGSIGWAYFSWRGSRMDLPSSPLVLAALSLTWAGIGLTLLGLIVGERGHLEQISLPSWIGWTWLIVASIVGYAAYTTLIAGASLSLTSTYAYVNPIVAVLLGSIVLGEPLTWHVILGLLIVAGSVAMVVSGERKK
ncbi:MAG: EamA family transporter [Actinomycetales bacterium]|nr:EamA family transporter [Actinomycetales bacterium]